MWNGGMNALVYKKLHKNQVNRMSDTRVPEQLLYAQLTSGKRATGQQKQHKDKMKLNMKKCNKDLTT